MNSLLILTGASGAGKTAIVERLTETCSHRRIQFFHFDSIRVPSVKEMVATYGSVEEWQRAMTLQWIRRLHPIALNESSVVFEGQSRISFLLEALEAVGSTHHRVLLIDCDDETRKTRLTDLRKQPELANSQMMSWAKYLRNEAAAAGLPIIDTSTATISEVAAKISGYL